MLLAVTAAELAGSGTVFTFTYIGKVNLQHMLFTHTHHTHHTHTHTHTLSLARSLTHSQVESNIGQHLWKDLNTFESNDSNSSHTHRINSLQSEVSGSAAE